MTFSLSTLKALLRPETQSAGTSDAVLGVDLGSSSVKVVQLKNNKGTPTLETYGELQLGPYEQVELGRNTHLPTQKAIEALNDIIREASVTAKYAVFALSSGSSFTSVIALPTLDQEQIGTMIPVEARKYIPVSLNKVTLDWVPIGTDPTTQYTSVLLTAVSNEAVAHYETIMKGSGLGTAAHEIEMFSAMRSVLMPEDEVVAIVDCGATGTRLYIVERGVLRKTHSVLYSGVEMTRALAASLKISFAEAEELKRAYGLLGKDDEPRVKKALEESIRRTLRELHTVIQKYGTSEGAPVKKIVVCGGGAMTLGLLPYITDVTSLPTIHAQPFTKVAYPAFLEDTLQEVGPTFAVALGAALRAYK